jgi:hypothetical protein
MNIAVAGTIFFPGHFRPEINGLPAPELGRIINSTLKIDGVKRV